MEKINLQTGMRVVLRDYTEAIILKYSYNPSEDDVYICSFRADIKKWDYLKAYNNTLEYFISSNQDYDIIKVYKPKHVYSILNFFTLKGKSINNDEWDMIWSRF